MKDARRMGRMIAVALAEGVTIPEDDLCKCVGIEHLLSLENARRIMKDRRYHVNAILARQHTCTPEQLCLVLQSSSKKAQSRANALAAGYWNMVK